MAKIQRQLSAAERDQTVREFCAEIGIHPATYYRNPDLYPPRRKIGPKTARILREDKAEWRKNLRMESE